MGPRLLLCPLLLAAGAFGCRAAPEAETLTVFAAASLARPFTELAGRFEATHPGTPVRLNLAGSQQLVLQLLAGARAGVLATADERWMRAAADSGLLAEPARIFAVNRLAVVVPVANSGSVRSPQDLARPGVKVVLAADAVPAGRYARQMLERLAEAPGYPSGYVRLVRANVVSEEENVTAVVSKVALGEADAGIAYRSDVSGRWAGRVALIDVPERYNLVARYPIAALATGDSDASREFIDLVLSAAGRDALRRAGFDLPAGGDQ
jgi:molybdate transport system substrate-binding protein